MLRIYVKVEDLLLVLLCHIQCNSLISKEGPQ